MAKDRYDVLAVASSNEQTTFTLKSTIGAENVNITVPNSTLIERVRATGENLSELIDLSLAKQAYNRGEAASVSLTENFLNSYRVRN